MAGLCAPSAVLSSINPSMTHRGASKTAVKLRDLLCTDFAIMLEFMVYSKILSAWKLAFPLLPRRSFTSVAECFSTGASCPRAVERFSQYPVHSRSEQRPACHSTQVFLGTQGPALRERGSQDGPRRLRRGTARRGAWLGLETPRHAELQGNRFQARIRSWFSLFWL